MAHLRKDPVTGHLMKTPSGHLAKMPTPDGCEYCDEGTTPLQYEITVSGVSYCGCCDRKKRVTSFPPTINGTWVVTQLLSDPCEWQYNATGSFGTVDYYCEDNDCIVCESHTITKFQIKLVKASTTQWYLRFVFGIDAAGVDRLYAFVNYEGGFYDSGQVPSDNCEEVVIDNYIDCCASGDPNNLKFGENGSATVTPVA